MRGTLVGQLAINSKILDMDVMVVGVQKRFWNTSGGRKKISDRMDRTQDIEDQYWDILEQTCHRLSQMVADSNNDYVKAKDHAEVKVSRHILFMLEETGKIHQPVVQAGW